MSADRNGPEIRTATDRHQWRIMPQVWWPWMCQLVRIESGGHSVDLEFVSMESCRVRGSTVATGTLFSIRLEGQAESRCRELDLVRRWTEAGATVTILAGRDGRLAWVCLGRDRQLVVLTGALSDIDSVEVVQEPAARADHRPTASAVDRSFWPRREQFGLA